MTDFEDALEYTRAGLGVPKDRAFLMLATETLLALYDYELSESDLSDSCRFDGSNDRGVDAYYRDDDSRLVIIIQAKSNQPEARKQQTDLNELREVPADLLRKATADLCNDEVRQILPALREAVDQGYTFRLIYALGSPIANRNRKWIAERVGRAELTDLPGCAVYVEVFDKEKLEDAYTRYLGTGSRSSTDFRFDLPSDQYHESSGSGFRTIEATMPAPAYLSAFEEYGDALFRYNPRFHLGSNRVNKDILDTLRERPEQFFLFNNGITAVCEGFTIEKGVLDVRDFQVVNGCQTTHALDEARKRFSDRLDKASINLRLIEGQGLQNAVSAGTNRQTALQYTDEVSGRPELRKLKDLFSRLNPPWFFEHKRGEWRSAPQRERLRFARGSGERTSEALSRSRVLRPKPVAQAALAARGEPGRAKDRVREIFTDVEDNADFQTIFGCKPYELLLPSLLHEAAAVWSLNNRVEAVAAQDPWVGWFKYHIVCVAYEFLKRHYGKRTTMLNETVSRKLVMDAEAWMPRVVGPLARGINREIQQRTKQPAELRRFLRNDEASHLEEMLESGLAMAAAVQDGGDVDFESLLP